jgi:hypothetical protein
MAMSSLVITGSISKGTGVELGCRIRKETSIGMRRRDAQSGGDSASDSDGMTCYSSGSCVGGGYFWDRETGATVGPY